MVQCVQAPAKSLNRRLLLICLSLVGVLTCSPARSNPPLASDEAVPAVMTVDDAVRWALQHNPQLAAVRQQHGIAAAGVVIARTYPFNPVWQSYVMATDGPKAADVTNAVGIVQTVRLDLEIRGQGKYRRGAADAALSRTDWEIAFQESNTAAQVIRAYHQVLYRQEKLRQVEQTVQLSEQGLTQVRALAEQGKLRAADLILARSEVEAARAQRGPRRVALAAAWNDLYRLLGLTQPTLDLTGNLEPPLLEVDPGALVHTALQTRADLHARQMAIAETEERLRLEVANRFGNPSVGPAYEYNETRVNFIGVTWVTPIPALNTRRGDIMQRQAERERAIMDLRQTEFQVGQDVKAALDRLKEARTWATSLQSEVVPDLQKNLEGLEKLFAQNEPGVDVLRVINVRREMLRAHDIDLDARWEVAQALADLVAAVGDPSLAMGPCLQVPAPALPPPRPVSAEPRPDSP